MQGSDSFLSVLDSDRDLKARSAQLLELMLQVCHELRARLPNEVLPALDAAERYWHGGRANRGELLEWQWRIWDLVNLQREEDKWGSPSDFALRLPLLLNVPGSPISVSRPLRLGQPRVASAPDLSTDLSAVMIHPSVGHD